MLRLTPGIEVNPQVVRTIVDAFKLVPELATKVLLRHEVGRFDADGRFVLPKNTDPWIPMESWIAAMAELAATVGAGKVFEVGMAIDKHSSLPREVATLEDALRRLDGFFHANHRREGVPMSDAKTGKMLEGIGHFVFESAVPGKIVRRVDIPYNCDFCRGVLHGRGARFQTGLLVRPLPGPCRAENGSYCRCELCWVAA